MKSNKLKVKSSTVSHISTSVILAIYIGAITASVASRENDTNDTSYIKTTFYSDGTEEKDIYADKSNLYFSEELKYCDKWDETYNGLYQRDIYEYETYKIDNYSNEEILNMDKEELTSTFGEPKVSKYTVPELLEEDNKYNQDLVVLSRTEEKENSNLELYYEYLVGLLLPISYFSTKYIFEAKNKNEYTESENEKKLTRK